MKTIAKIQLWIMDVTYAIADALLGLSDDEKFAWWIKRQILKEKIER